MLHNLRLDILPSSIRHFHCPPSYPLPPISKHTAKELDHLQPDSFVNLPAEAVPEASQQPEGEVLMVVRARDSSLLLHQVVPHPRALGSPLGGEVAQVVIPVLPSPCVQGPGRLPVVVALPAFYYWISFKVAIKYFVVKLNHGYRINWLICKKTRHFY